MNGSLYYMQNHEDFNQTIVANRNNNNFKKEKVEEMSDLFLHPSMHDMNMLVQVTPTL